MNLVKSLEVFNPNNIKCPIHIIGVGATGSSIAELLRRVGIKNITIWDDDIVESKNVANQIYTNVSIGKKKTEALTNILTEINPDIDITQNGYYNGEYISGYVFLCVDNIEIHKLFSKSNYINANIYGVFETRLALLEGQSYYANWDNIEQKDKMRAYQDFTNEEARENLPVGGCNEILSLVATVRTLASYTVANFVNVANDNCDDVKNVIIVSPFKNYIDAF